MTLSMTQALSHPHESGNPAPFRSILFDESEAGTDIDGQEAPEFFTDLNLDQIVASITAGRDEYNLKPFFYTPLSHVETINYRHDILRDLENQALFGHIRSFAEEMRTMRGTSRPSRQTSLQIPEAEAGSWTRWTSIASAVRRLTRDLTLADLRSRGFLAFREYLTSYIESRRLRVACCAETQKLKADLSGVRYCLHIKGNRIKVSRYDSEPDYGADVLQTFEKFKQGAAREYRFDFSSTPDMNHVEAAILDLVARLYPDIFSSLDQYCNRHRDYLDDTIGTFDREVQFYVACLEHIERFKPAGLPFCYPTVTDRSKEVYGREVFDLALANKLIRENASGGDERLLPKGPGTHICRVRAEPGRENDLRPHFWTAPLPGQHRLSRARQGSEALSLRQTVYSL